MEAAIWNEQVFQLAKDLEKEGGEANITEAVSYYRRLAQESHIDAAWRLARLLEDRDIKEAFYRYKQVQNLDTDGGDLARSSVFRQAQLYHIGVYKGKNEIFAPNSKKASELYEEAFRLGVSQQEIAMQYDRQQDYQMALEWQQREESNKPSQQLTKDTKGSILLMQHKWQRKPDYVQQIRGGKLTELHLAILHQDGQLRSTQKKQHAVLTMIHSILRNEKTDINAQDIWKRTPLHLAISRWYFEVVELLLRLGADVNIPDKERSQLMQLAIKSGYPNLVNFLKQWSKSSSTAFGRFSQFLDICRKAFTKP